MARDELPREDLIGEATALVERIELTTPDGVTVVAGFRIGGEFSIFFGDDPVYHFNALNELRRAYGDGLLIKAVRRRLFSLRRVRTEHESQLVRRELSDAEQKTFVLKMADRLRQLDEMLATGNYEVGRQIPTDIDVLARVRTWLDECKSWPIADRPNV